MSQSTPNVVKNQSNEQLNREGGQVGPIAMTWDFGLDRKVMRRKLVSASD